MMRVRWTYWLLITSALVLAEGCAIRDDIPYPTVESDITAFEVEGQCDADGTGEGSAVIDKSNRSISLYVNDMVQLSRLKITRLEATNDPTVFVKPDLCVTPAKFPNKTFSAPEWDADTRMDFSDEVTFTLHTYQDYKWTVRVEQIIKREVELEGQVGNAIVDATSRIVVVYVRESQSLNAIPVRKFSLGGQHGRVMPDPTSQTTYNFSQATKFYVSYAWAQQTEEWTMFVYHTAEDVQPTADATTNEKGATVISGTRPNGVTPVVEYKEEGGSWNTVPASALKLPTSTSYEVVLSTLKSDVKYIYKVSFGGIVTQEKEFYFVGEQLENASLDNWHFDPVGSDGKFKLYKPWSEGGNSYWDTGNRGATTVGDSNSTPTDDTPTGKGKAANLQSKYIVIKFAAGNIFTGTYIETDGTNGVLGFGRPFSSKPAKMEFDYKYKTSTITRCGDSSYEYLKGKPDSCQVYILLADWEGEVYNGKNNEYKGQKFPFIIRTRPSERHLIDLHDPNIIAYAQMTKGEDVTDWTHETLTLNYRYTDRQPKWVVVVASASKFGDFFTGGETSLLNVDNFRLIYE